MLNKYFKIVLYTICILLVSTITIASQYEYRPITLRWDYDPPPDIERYEVKCTEDDSGIVKIYPTEVSRVDNTENTWQWRSDNVKVTSGKAGCWVRVFDLAGQDSGWSDPSPYFDWPPAAVENVIINIGN